MAGTRYTVVPHEGVAPVRLGMARAECRRVMPEAPRTFRKGPGDGGGTDAFHSSAFQVFYDAQDRVEYIELSRGPEVDPQLAGVSVLEVAADEAVAHVRRLAEFDADDPEVGYSYVFPDLDVALWRPVIPESDDDPDGRTFSTVGVGISGYHARR